LYAVNIDAKKFYNQIEVKQYSWQSLMSDLFIKGGIRWIVIGSVMYCKYNLKD
jgi:tryptophanase